MTLNTATYPIFEHFHNFSGTYISESLTIKLQSLGENNGLILWWDWLRQARKVELTQNEHIEVTEELIIKKDIALLSQDGGIITLSWLTNTQPAWGAGALRIFFLESLSTDGGIDASFVWPSVAGWSEKIRFNINDKRILLYTHVLKDARPFTRELKKEE